MLAGLEKGVVLLVSRKLLPVTSVVVSGASIVRPLTSSCYLFSSRGHFCSCRLFSSSQHSSSQWHNNNRGNSTPSEAYRDVDRGRRRSRRGGGAAGFNDNNLSGPRGGRGKDNRLAPVKVSNSRPWKTEEERLREQMDMSTSEYYEAFNREIKDYGDPMDEPDPNLFTKKFDDFLREAAEMKDRIKTRRLTKKHYADVIPKEVSLLTWAEKENIRYLYDTDPWQWTPEALSEAYPITPDGVSKLVHSSMRLRIVKDVQDHDAKVAAKIKLIQTGVIPMTEDLEKKLKIRELIPLRLGHLGMNPDNFIDTSLPKELGQFARLPVVKNLSDGDFYDPSSTTTAADDGLLKPQLSKKELIKILKTGNLMTFSEFEHKMDEKKAGKKAGDMKYMLEELHHTNSIHSVTPEDINFPYGKDYNPQFPSNIQKYSKPEETGQLVEVQVEGGQAFIYQPETGYQKPYGTPSSSGDDGDPVCPQRIVIPDECRAKRGATYKVGCAYYDENGEFLYRVV